LQRGSGPHFRADIARSGWEIGGGGCINRDLHPLPLDDEHEETFIPEEEKTVVPVSDEVYDVGADGADGNDEDSKEGGEPVMEETKLGGHNHKKFNSLDKRCVEILAYLVKYIAAHVDYYVRRSFVTADGHHLGNWVHDQRKKYKSRTLTDSQIDMITPLDFQFTNQWNVGGNKFTVPVSIASFFM
jgi:hypothetical protein